MRGFIIPPIALLIALFLLAGATTLRTKLANPEIPKITEDNTSTQPNNQNQTPTPIASPTAPPANVVVKTQTNIECTVTLGSDKVPPGKEIYLTAGLKDKTDPIQSVDWDVDGDNKVDFYKQSSWFSNTYKEPGNYVVKAKVTLKNGQETGWCSKALLVDYHDVSCTLSTSDTSAKTLTSGPAPLKVCINSGTSSDSVLDKDGVEGYLWDYDGDGNWDSSLVTYGSTCYTYNEPKNYTIRMQTQMKSGRSAICTTSVNVTN